MGLTYANVEFDIDISAMYPGLQNFVNNIQNKNPGAHPLYGGSRSDYI